jgi:hypothetical protein
MARQSVKRQNGLLDGSAKMPQCLVEARVANLSKL